MKSKKRSNKNFLICNNSDSHEFLKVHDVYTSYHVGGWCFFLHSDMTFLPIDYLFFTWDIPFNFKRLFLMRTVPCIISSNQQFCKGRVRDWA